MAARPIKTVSVVVSAIDEPLPGVKRFVLSDQDHWPLPPFTPGAHIDLHLGGGLVRTYSLCNAPSDRNRYVIAVKHEVAGRGGSAFVHERLDVGASVGVSLPRGGIRTTDTGMNVFIAGGIGVTPFISTIRDLELRGQTNYVLHWSSAGAPSLVDMLGDAIAAGRVRLYDTRVETAPDMDAILNACDENAKAYCCGPVRMLDAFERIVEGWPDARKHVERFTPPKPVDDTDAAPYTVVLARSGKEATVEPNVGLVGTLEALGADVSVSCGGGVCGACRTTWLEGPPIHRDRVLSPEERAQDVMVCVAGCAGSRLVLDL
ncbi:oxidoreductase/oxygenase, vanB family protein [Cupriavidus sp. HMR-1]|uniref:PDR/VanB family oxidoreductase n=1 Tax=Cupriavidus sp. HMR-1 TaxID=1249621 RepID=UPI0002A1C139|nr:PDR/VanB family oxidoreductase [Cupriavidus sp. HMR-1]EKZ97886.1 oxidoreductase/oxygenase, vanB family protein [Cupriavidus sp. HMR-1]